MITVKEVLDLRITLASATHEETRERVVAAVLDVWEQMGALIDREREINAPTLPASQNDSPRIAQ